MNTSEIANNLSLLFTPSKRSNEFGAYHLKHVYSALTGEYITEDQFEELLKEQGYRMNNKKETFYIVKTKYGKSIY
jgi:thermostable 8-oxoguanine DNA glycosylase